MIYIYFFWYETIETNARTFFMIVLFCLADVAAQNEK